MASRRRGRRRDRLLDEGEDVEGISNPSLVCVLHPPPPPSSVCLKITFGGWLWTKGGGGGGVATKLDLGW